MPSDDETGVLPAGELSLSIHCVMMLTDFPLFPEQASTMAKQVDALYIMLTIVTGAVSVLIFTMIFVLAIVYRRLGRAQQRVPALAAHRAPDAPALAAA